MKQTNSLAIRRISYFDHIDQIKKLFDKHWDEIGMTGSSGLELDPDHETYEWMANRNKHLGLGVFDETTLIGYLSIFIYKHAHHKTHTFAITDCFFMDKSYRSVKSFRTVCKLFNVADEILREEFNVSHFILQVDSENDLHFLAESLNFKRSNVSYIKSLR